MFMLKSTHEKAMKTAADDYAAALKSISNNAKNDRAIDQRALDAERAITASLRAEIESMKPDYELGKKRREQYAKDNATRKERRAVARTQNPTVRAINEQTEVLNRSLAQMLKTAKEIS